MKAIGIALVVYGHVAHATTVPLTPPIYLKQFGVTLFLFVTGFTLAGERRSAAGVVFARLFPMYLYGVALAALLAIAGLLTGSGSGPSNALPFLAGVNVVLDHFPANPSTWYIGMYAHVLLIWAWLFRSVRVQWWMIGAALLVEIPSRALLLAYAGPYPAYMIATSWITVFLLGMLYGGRGNDAAERTSPMPYVVLLIVGGVTWAQIASSMAPVDTFPFMTLPGVDALPAAFAVSIAASTLYFAVTALVFQITRRLPAPAIVRFAARNSLIVFLAHMPIFFALNPVLAGAGVPYAGRVAIQLAVCGAALALLSEAIGRIVPADALRARLLARFGEDAPGSIGGVSVLSSRSSS
jgi:peptidoglycan/LPS O-acetylase OafA/YrhL